MKALWIAFGGYTVAWGFWIGNPFWDTFRPQAGLYGAMADFMPEWAWGAHAAVVGLAIIYGIVFKWPRGLVWGHIAMMYHWALVGLFYAYGDWRNTGALTSFALVGITHLLWCATRPKPAVIHPLDTEKTSV